MHLRLAVTSMRGSCEVIAVEAVDLGLAEGSVELAV